MIDIVERLRDLETAALPVYQRQIINEAAVEIERLRAAAEKDAKHTGNLEYVLANIRDDVIPDNLEPSDYARATLDAT